MADVIPTESLQSGRSFLKQERNASGQGKTASKRLAAFQQLASSMLTMTPKRLGRRRDSFEEFQENTQDAWEIGDDEIMSMFPVQAAMTVLPVVDAVIGKANDARQTSSATLAEPKGEGTQKTHTPVPVRSSVSSGDGQLKIAGMGHSASQQNLGNQVVNSPPPPLPVQQPAGTSKPASDVSAAPADVRGELAKILRFNALLNNGAGYTVDLAELRQISWSGVPMKMRPLVWKILSGYLPAAADRRAVTLDRKRKEYFGFVEQYFDTRHDHEHQDTYRQIHIDIPRTSPSIPLLQDTSVQEIFERILYTWAIRHPASGYVQGMNDLVTPFFIAFIAEYTDASVDGWVSGGIGGGDESSPPPDLSLLLSTDQKRALEADCYWCLSKLLDGVQDNYVFAQPGIQKKVKILKELITRIDGDLCKHLEMNSVEFLQFSFRWMNNLLLRELPLRCAVRLWDTYQAESDGFASFHLYVCAAFLMMFSPQLMKEVEFQGIMTLLQGLPTESWDDSEMRELLAKAYQLKCTYAESMQQQFIKASAPV